MNLQEYTPYWNQFKPVVTARLEELRANLLPRTPYTITEPFQVGDEEFGMAIDLTREGVCVLSVEYRLTDADVRGCEGGGVGMMLSLEGINGLALHRYTPYNYTPSAFTTDMDELLSRVDGVTMDQIADNIVNEALTNETLIREVEEAIAANKG